MAPHSSTLAWKIPWTEEPGRLQSMGSLRVRHDWATSLSLFIFMRWRRKWQPTPVFLPGESQGRGSLMCCRLWGHTSQTRLKRLSSSSINIIIRKIGSCGESAEAWWWGDEVLGQGGDNWKQKASDSHERHDKDVSPLSVLVVQVFPRLCHLSQLGAFPKFPGCLGSDAFSPSSQVPQNRADVPPGSDSKTLVDPLVPIPSCPSVIRVSHRSQTEFIFINPHS